MSAAGGLEATQGELSTRGTMSAAGGLGAHSRRTEHQRHHVCSRGSGATQGELCTRGTMSAAGGLGPLKANCAPEAPCLQQGVWGPLKANCAPEAPCLQQGVWGATQGELSTRGTMSAAGGQGATQGELYTRGTMSAAGGQGATQGELCTRGTMSAAGGLGGHSRRTVHQRHHVCSRGSGGPLKANCPPEAPCLQQGVWGATQGELSTRGTMFAAGGLGGHSRRTVHQRHHVCSRGSGGPLKANCPPEAPCLKPGVWGHSRLP